MMGVPAALAWLLVTIMLSEATTTGAETATMTMIPIFSEIPRHQTSKDFQVLVRVEAPPAAGEKGWRVPIDLAVVLNVGGGAERLDSVKKAVRFIIRQLHDDDRMAVVGSSGSRLFAETATGFLDIRGGRRLAERSVDTLVARDGYALHTSGSGLEEAIKMLAGDGELPASTMSRASFIILVSDTKESSRFGKLLKSHPVVVHTIGMGAAHDPKALLTIAKESHGTYSFVDDQNMDGITGAVAVCLAGLKAVAAVGTRVRLEAAAAVEAGARSRIERIESGGYESTISSDKASGDVAVGILYAGEVKSFIVHLHVPPATSAASVKGGCDKQELLTASFLGHFGDGDAAPTVIQAILSVQRPPPEGVGIAGAATLRKVPTPVVMNHIAQFGVLDMVTTFVEKEIWELSSITTEVTTAMATKLQGQWEQFVQERQFWIGLDLGVLEIEINKMVSSLAAGSGGGSSALSYMLSWLSSYQMQRPTAMGSPSSVAAAFVTLSMQLTLQQATATVTGLGGGDGGGGCPACECDDCGCVEPAPPPVFVPSGRGDGTYRVNAAYPAALLLDAINQAMNQMYLALVQASNVRQCNSTKVEVVPPPRAVA